MSNKLSEMEDDWNTRAKERPFYWVDPRASSEEELRALGDEDADMILSDVAEFLSPDSAVLEIGCGIGRLMTPMAGRFREIWGADISDEMLQRGRARLAYLDNVRFVKTTASEFRDVPSDYFGFCYSYWTLQHVLDRALVRKYLEETYRVLKLGGIFKFQVGGIYATNPFRSFYDGGEIDTWDNWLRFTMSEIVSLAELAGFQMIAAYHDPRRRTRDIFLPRSAQQRVLWVVGRKDRGMSEWESTCFATGRALARLLPPGSRIILPEDALAVYLQAAAGTDFEFLYSGDPSETAGAIEMLEAYRVKGGEYLLLSRYGRWWLDYYTGLSDYLDSRYRKIEDAPDYVIFDLRESHGQPRATVQPP